MFHVKHCSPEASGITEMRKRVIFKGMVQGVGFRYTTLMISRNYNITGTVRNQPDGSVLLIAEGERGEVTEFITDIKERKSMNIRSVSEATEPDVNEFTDFAISY
jgi:acylphosphatase